MSKPLMAKLPAEFAMALQAFIADPVYMMSGLFGLFYPDEMYAMTIRAAEKGEYTVETMTSAICEELKIPIPEGDNPYLEIVKVILRRGLDSPEPSLIFKTDKNVH